MTFIKLKEKYIVLKSPIFPMLIDTEEETHSELTDLECALMEYLDGTRTVEDIYKMLTSFQTTTLDEERKIRQSLGQFFTKFRDVITYATTESERKRIYYGASEIILPYEISIELTDKCLMECIHCYKESSPTKSTFVNIDQLMAFLSNIAGKVYSVQLTGGDPMLHPDFFRIMEFCKDHFNDIRISTTGLLLTKQNVDRFQGTHVYLSPYSFDKFQNKEYIRNDAFDQIIDAARLLVDAGIHTCINTIACDRNIDQIPSFISCCKELGVDGLGIGKVVRVGRGKTLDRCELCSMKCEKIIAEIDESFSSAKMYLSTFASSNMPKELHCGFYKWIINEIGEILPCAFFPADKFALGHITDPIDEVFTKDKFESMKRKLSMWCTELEKSQIAIEEICPTLHLINQYA